MKSPYSSHFLTLPVFIIIIDSSTFFQSSIRQVLTSSCVKVNVLSGKEKVVSALCPL